MELSVIEIAAIIFALFAWSRALLRLRDRKISVWEFGLWTIIWAGVIIAMISLKTAEIISVSLGVKRPIDLAVFFGMLLLFYLVFRLYVKLEQQGQDLTKITRTIAVRHPRKKK